MPTEIIVSLISSVIGGLLVAVVSYVFTRKKIEAETEKLRAEAEKFRAEAAKINAEADNVRTKTITEFYTSLLEKGQWDLLALQLRERPEDINPVAKELRKQMAVKQQLQTLRSFLESDQSEHIAEESEQLLQSFVQKAGE